MLYRPFLFHVRRRPAVARHPRLTTQDPSAHARSSARRPAARTRSPTRSASTLRASRPASASTAPSSRSTSSCPSRRSLCRAPSGLSPLCRPFVSPSCAQACARADARPSARAARAGSTSATSTRRPSSCSLTASSTWSGPRPTRTTSSACRSRRSAESWTTLSCVPRPRVPFLPSRSLV